MTIQPPESSFQAPSGKPANIATEPWMRGTHLDLDPLRRGVVHALEQAGEDVEKWCAGLGTRELHHTPFELPSIAFHLRHIARSLDRLLSYAEDARMNAGLSSRQIEALGTEAAPGQTAAEILSEFREGVRSAKERVAAVQGRWQDPRGIGRLRLPTTLGGLLVHCAEHTQRHVGQLVLTARLVRRVES